MISYARTIERYYKPGADAVRAVGEAVDSALDVFGKYPARDHAAMASVIRNMGINLIAMADEWEKRGSK